MRVIFCLIVILFSLVNIDAQRVNLQYFINKALANSPLIKDYNNQVQSNQIDSLVVHAGFVPHINAVSNNMYAPVINGFGYDEAITNGAQVNAQISVTKEIVGKRNRNNQYHAVSVQKLLLLNTKKISEQDLVKTITDQFIIAYGLGQQYDYSSRELNILKKEQELLRRLTEQNVVNQIDYLSFLVTLQQQEFQCAQIKSDYQDNIATLNYLCGIEDTAMISLADPELSILPLLDAENSVFYQKFVLDSMKLAVENRQIDFSYKPKVSLFGDAGYLSSLMFQPWNNFGASAGINFSMPLYDGKQRKMLHNKNTIEEETRQAYSSFYVKQYRQQVNQLLQRLNANRQISGHLNQQLSYSQALIDANQKLLQTGEVKITDYIIALNNYLSVKNSIVQNKIEKYHLINQFNYLDNSK